MRLAASRLLLGLCVPMLALPGLVRQAHAQLDSREAISLQNQILELRHEIQQNGVAAGGTAVAPPIGTATQAAPAGDASAALTPQLLDRVSALEGQVRDLRGQLDQLANQVQQQNAALTKQIGDLTFTIQQGHAPAPGDTAAQAVSPPASASVRRTPEIALQQGEAALARHDYTAAGAAAREVLSGPKGPRQADAQFLLAQSQAGLRQYQQAATSYYDVYSHAPHGPRAPDALLGVTASLLALGDKTDACQALHKLHVEFTQPAPRVRQAAASLRGRAGCH